jgi:hypothetical protein
MNKNDEIWKGNKYKVNQMKNNLRPWNTKVQNSLEINTILY